MCLTSCLKTVNISNFQFVITKLFTMYIGGFYLFFFNVTFIVTNTNSKQVTFFLMTKITIKRCLNKEKYNDFNKVF